MTQAQDERNIHGFVVNQMLKDFEDMDMLVATQFISKAYEVRVFKDTSYDSLSDWYFNKFKPNVFLLDEDEYTEASIQSLKIQFLIAGTDFGTSRQRDMGQKWSDTIRGYLGELGLKQLLANRFNIDIELGHEPGRLEDYLDLDIRQVKNISDTSYRNPNINVSIKTTKSNGVWLDIPGDQFSHSDLYVLALIGVDVNHLFSFFKHLSVFKDKVLKKGVDNNCINQLEADEIYNKVPSFRKIYGYIAGLVSSDINKDDYTYEGIMGRTNFTITNWSGKYEEDYLEIVKSDKGARSVKFAGIGSFTQSNRHIYGLAGLKNSDDDWKTMLVDKI
jgi:hypothetical protein